MWHLMEQRMRYARRGETKEGGYVVRECQAMAKEESWSGWNPVKEQVGKLIQGDCKKPKRGVKREEWEVRQDFRSSEAIRRICSDEVTDLSLILKLLIL